MAMLQVNAAGFAQRVTFVKKNATLKDVFNEIYRQTGYSILWSAENISYTVSADFQDARLTDVLNKCLEGRQLTYTIEEKTIVIRPSKAPVPDKAAAGPSTAITVRGQVVDTKGTPLPGIVVVLKTDPKTGTVTDNNGHYMIQVPENGILVFKAMGFKPVEQPVNGQPTLDVTMETETSGLNEVIVVGYGTQKKSSLTSAVADIDGEDLMRRPVANVPQALQGLAPGVTVTDRGGGPGKSNATIRIRGITTLNGNDPLIIVDGIEQRLQDINPNDIESLTVLKDAASTAIYGSRAANGVVLVTTKRAKGNKLTVNYDGYYAIQKSIYNPKQMGLEEFMREQNAGYVNAGRTPLFSDEDIRNWTQSTDRLKYPLANDWFNVMFDPAPQQNHTLTISGGNEQIRTLLSVNHFGQDGIIPNSTSAQNGVRLNTDFKVSKKISLSGDFNYRVKNYRSPISDGSVFRYMIHSSNFTVPRYPDGTYGLSQYGISPLVTAELDGTSRFKNTYAIVNLRGEAELMKGLKFQAQYGITTEGLETKTFANAYEIRDYYDRDLVRKTVSPNKLTESRDNNTQTTLNALLTYDVQLGKHAINALLGYSQVYFKADTLSTSRNNFYNNDVQAISQGSPDSRDNLGFGVNWGLASYFGRITYNYAEKYLFEANARYDGSSRFSSRNRYSFFPSFSAAWRLSAEPFWEDLGSVVNDFKLRASWGQTGNQTVGLYAYYETLSAINYNFSGEAAQGILQTTMANQDLAWETTEQANIGLDASFLNGKLGVTFDYYSKKTSGILLELPIPAAIGLNPPPQNAGIVENKGWELSLSYRKMDNAFHYGATFNIANVRNRILDLEGTGPYPNGSPNEIMTIRKEGLPIDYFWGYQTMGLFQSQAEIDNYPTLDPNTKPGDLKYKDVNNDKKINSDDLVGLGSNIPRYTFGLNLTFDYNGFDANIFFQGVGKAEGIASGAYREQGNWGSFTLDMQKDYWTPENTGAKFPRPEVETIRNSQMSDFWMINTAYLKLKNLQIGYTFPAGITKRAGIERLRVYAGGSNLFTLSKATKWGLDPEFPSGRIDYYPQVSLYTFGVNLTF